jgi:D-sedoheptulose 7-phosphate isomerase
MEYKEIILEQIQHSIAVKHLIYTSPELIELIDQCANVVIDCYKKGGKTLIAGNGGSAADAQHIAGEFLSRFYFDRPGLASIALSTDTSVMTAISNDYGYEKLFERQVQAQGCFGDVFIGITTSGNSKNILNALGVCKEKGITSICFTGDTGGLVGPLADYCIRIPSSETPRIQESHILVGHIICCLVEQELFNSLNPKK